MKLDRVKFQNGRAYVDEIIKSGKQQGYIRKRYGEIIVCKNCREESFAKDGDIRRGNGKFCSLTCKSQLEYSPRWKGGQIKNWAGYILVRSPNHPHADKRGYVFQHRLIVEKQIGRYLKPKEVTHHINKTGDDNRLPNLIAFKNNGLHRKFETGVFINPQDIIFDGRNLIT